MMQFNRFFLTYCTAYIDILRGCAAVTGSWAYALGIYSLYYCACSYVCSSSLVCFMGCGYV